jgi:hypothetical protein
MIMEKERINENRQTQQVGAGRLCKPEEKQSAPVSVDISFVDCQEGDMNNGELGGNFTGNPGKMTVHQDEPAWLMKYKLDRT